uniref:Uncharacterized protein n=1 Tax=Mustela putorius furo TaxID=9669 RepID=M3YHX9_MUSPF
GAEARGGEGKDRQACERLEKKGRAGRGTGSRGAIARETRSALRPCSLQLREGGPGASELEGVSTSSMEPTLGLRLNTLRSSHKLGSESDAQPTEPPGCPYMSFSRSIPRNRITRP